MTTPVKLATLAEKYPLPDKSYKRRASTDTLVIHCAETPAKDDIGVKEIRQWHVEENGWIDVGYHLIIRRNGVVEEGRPLWAVGSHVQGHNATSIGICLVGGCDAKDREEDNFTEEQWVTLLKLVKRLLHAYTITDVRGHRDFPKVTKYCPSFDVATWLKENKKKLHEDAC